MSAIKLHSFTSKLIEELMITFELAVSVDMPMTSFRRPRDANKVPLAVVGRYISNNLLPVDVEHETRVVRKCQCVRLVIRRVRERSAVVRLLSHKIILFKL